MRSGVHPEVGEVAGALEARDVPETVDRPTTAEAAGRRSRLTTMLPMLIGNVVLPYLIYVVLGNSGFSTMTALTVSAVPPVVMTVFTALRKQKLDMLGMISLATIVVAIVTSMLSGNARFMLAKDGLLPLVLGIAMLGSLLIGKPLILLILVVVQVTCVFTLPIGFALPMLNILQLVVSAGLVMGIRSALRKSMRQYAELPA
jgi:hypothetical protein